MPPYLTPLQIFENYKKANPQKCKGKSTTEICRLAGLSNKQIAELKTTSAWLFCFDKENSSINRDFKMTEIMGGNFSKVQSKHTKVKALHKINQADIECLARKSDYTTNLQDLQNYISKNLDGNNILEFLTKYEKVAGKSIIEKLCDSKLANNTQRKNIALSLVNKIEQYSRNKNKDFSDLIILLKDEISHQFDKSGFIETSYIQAPFQALVKMVQRKPLEFNEQKAGDFEREFSSKNLKYSSKKEKKDMLGKRNIGKSITYDLGKGKSFVEYYLYDYSKQAYRISDKQFLENGKVVKTAIYDEFENLSQVHEYQGNKHNAYFFKNNNIGTSTISDNSSYQEISHRKGEVYERHTYVDGKNIREHFNTDNENMFYYPVNYRISYFKDNKSESKKNIINTYFEIESDNIDSGLFQELKMQLSAGEETRYGKKVLDYTKSILVKRAKKLNVDISDLIEKYLTLKNDNKDDIYKGISLLARIRGRCRRKENPKEIFIPVSITLNGKVDDSSVQGAMGDCWLLAGINALRRSCILNKILQYDNKKKEIIVTLPGAPKGKQVYRYSQKDVDKCTEFSNGDSDVRAIEMAISDMLYATGMKKCSIEGGFEKEAIYYLTAKKENFDWQYRKNNSENMEKLKTKLNKETKREYSVGGCSFVKNIEQYGIIPNHAYTVTKIDQDYVYIMNPYGEKNGDKMELVEKKVPINIFIESCMSLSLFDV